MPENRQLQFWVDCENCRMSLSVSCHAYDALTNCGQHDFYWALCGSGTGKRSARKALLQND